MNYIVIIITGITCLIFGLLLGYNYANKELSNIEEAIDYIEETNDTINVEVIQFLNAASEIELLKKIEKGDSFTVEQHVIDNLGSYYKMSSEAVDDNMASENEIGIVRQINTLSKKSMLFKKVVEYQD